ncbi:AAA family ATPase [Mycoplasmopsis caviae]|uniref:5-methylcytosine-specific restriction enzyme B n=1 Tax=Mycoplasmopsis caviae TaxID=55603 RepID=A0A3P8KAQ8_9BACT|nr:AAA family ATPase [Mycoplasmopsis caviae]UUD35469.1 AAA family ATPase [Mycoplasmopsis caviae]VDR41754.1 5-methylcytosine-specific restriction enzyme B [Mycoplasmopsis caviae]
MSNNVNKLTRELIDNWVIEEVNKLEIEYKKANNIINENRIIFKQRFGINALLEEGLNFLKLMFNKCIIGLPLKEQSLLYTLEYGYKNWEDAEKVFGNVEEAPYKYPVYSDQKKVNDYWYLGNKKNKEDKENITDDKAIEIALEFRKNLALCIDIIVENSTNLINKEDYLNLFIKLSAVIPNFINENWIIKYFHMLFPTIFPATFGKEAQDHILKYLKLDTSEEQFERLFFIMSYIKKLKISPYSFARLCHLIRNNKTKIKIMEKITKKYGINEIIYGVPGSGKSHLIKNEYCNNDEFIERIVFHPDYTYSDFVGQILPKLNDEGNIEYSFNPGPFTRIVKKAYENKEKMWYLIIEEINRGNAPAIFGDIFQLLDRNENGESEYSISNSEIAKEIFKDESKKIRIPSNLSIICTMNTSDQNVFTLDTAFQRRWNMRLVSNNFDESESDFAKTKILDTSVTWKKFINVINSTILNKSIQLSSSEDKRLGTHFVSKNDLLMSKDNQYKNSLFSQKVLRYLWDDAFKFNKEDLFNIVDVNNLEGIIENFSRSKEDDRFRAIFKDNICELLFSNEENNKGI